MRPGFLTAVRWILGRRFQQISLRHRTFFRFQVDALEARLALSITTAATYRPLSVNMSGQFDVTDSWNSGQDRYAGNASATGTATFTSATAGSTTFSFNGNGTRTGTSGTRTIAIAGTVVGGINNGQFSLGSGSSVTLFFPPDPDGSDFAPPPTTDGGTFNTSTFASDVRFRRDLGGGEVIQGHVFGTAAETTTATTDLIASAKSLGGGSYEFNAAVTGKFMHTATMGTAAADVHLYWSTTNTAAGKISELSTGPLNLYWNSGNLKVTASALGAAPTGAKFLVLVIDPNNKIAEASETNNTAAVALSPRISVVGRDTTNGSWTAALNSGSNTFTNKTPIVTWSTAVAWTNVFAADVNGDGKDDLLGRNPTTGAWQVSVNQGNQTLTNSTFTTWSTSGTWIDVLKTDVNGDGKKDIVGRDTKTGQILVSVSQGTTAVTSVWGTWPMSATFVDVKAKDMNGDGKIDYIGRNLSTGQWNVQISNGSRFTNAIWGTWLTSITWDMTQMADVNGDGKTDIVSRNASNGWWYVATSTGTALAAQRLWLNWATSSTWTDAQLHDMNGDGKFDLIGRVGNTWHVGISDGTKFTDSIWSTWSAGTYTNILYADFNGDGKEDVLGRLGNTWFVALSTGTTLAAKTAWGTWGSATTNVMFAQI